MKMGQIRHFIVVIALLSSFYFVSACEEGSERPNPDDCNSYITCVHGEERVNKCPSGLKYNGKSKMCDWPANVDCGNEMTEGPGDMDSGVVPPHVYKRYSVNSGSAPRFAPYFDVMLTDTLTMSQVSDRTGQNDFTLAFVLGSNGGCVPKWGGERDLDDKDIIREIRTVQARGGQVIIATGGAAGPYIEHSCSSVDTLANAYIMMLDVVKTNHLDIDVEAPINIDMVSQALAKVQRERPGTTVSYTLMVQAEDYGLNPDLGVKVLEGAKKHGVDVHIVNPMTMEFGGSSPDWGDAVIGAAKSVLKQMKEIWPEKSRGELKRMLGVTPMLGRNFNGKVFETRHGMKLVDWANENRIGLLAFWSIARDNGNCPGGGISPTCSSTSQSLHEFTKIFQGFKS